MTIDEKKFCNNFYYRVRDNGKGDYLYLIYKDKGDQVALYASRKLYRTAVLAEKACTRELRTLNGDDF